MITSGSFEEGSFENDAQVGGLDLQNDGKPVKQLASQVVVKWVTDLFFLYQNNV